MLQRKDLISKAEAVLNEYPEILERWQVGDPLVRAMLTSIIEVALALSRDNDVNIIEPFIKSKERTIIADAINKGILPIATACQYTISIENTGDKTVNLAQGRIIEDNLGQQWQLMSSASIPPQQQIDIPAEQSYLQVHTETIQQTESFYQIHLPNDDAFLCDLQVFNLTQNQQYKYQPKLMNAGKGDYAYSLFSDDLKVLSIMFGDSNRVANTAQANDEIKVIMRKSYGEISTHLLRQANLQQVLTDDERYLTLFFKKNGLLKAGTNPLNTSQLRLLASFPSTYDDNAVFMGNFDFLLRKKFMQRFDYMAVWNETIQEKFYGASLDNINHLNLTVVAKNQAEQQVLVEQMKQAIAQADSLFQERVRIKTAEIQPYHLTIQGNISSVHDIDTVKLQIKQLLLSHFGRGSIAASYFHGDGFNRQEIATMIRQNIIAFQDRISDFSVIANESQTKPHQWLFLTDDSIHVDLRRTADNGQSLWTF